MPVINDFTLAVATVNGSGSASSNTILAKTIFRMGVPVAAKNYFPSNIAGLPTWYVVRVTEKGWHCRSGRHDFTVAFNEATAEEDIKAVEPGGVLMIDEDLPHAKTRIQHFGPGGLRLGRRPHPPDDQQACCGQ